MSDLKKNTAPKLVPVFVDDGEFVNRAAYILTRDNNTELRKRIAALDRAIKEQQAYIDLLDAELHDAFVIAYNHGFRSHRTEQGFEAREKIDGALRAAGYFLDGNG